MNVFWERHILLIQTVTEFDLFYLIQYLNISKLRSPSWNESYFFHLKKQINKHNKQTKQTNKKQTEVFVQCFLQLSASL